MIADTKNLSQEGFKCLKNAIKLIKEPTFGIDQIYQVIIQVQDELVS